MENTPINILVIILLGAILGMVGQGLRVVVGLKKLSDDNSTKTSDQQTQFSNQQLVTSLIIAFAIGAIAGVLATIDIINKHTIDKSTIMAIIAAGYAGTDFIEGFMKTAVNK